MTDIHKAPGVYIQEINAFPNAVVAVPTAIPAFVGYTEKSVVNGKPCHMQAIEISSLLEYESIFGNAPATQFTLTEVTTPSDEYAFEVDGHRFQLIVTSGQFLLYRSMQLFFQNGGGQCYVVSVGSYLDDVSAAALCEGLDVVSKEVSVTLLAVPDAVLLNADDCDKVQCQMRLQCENLQDRFAILDVHGGMQGLDVVVGSANCIDRFRSAMPAIGLSYAAAYYPWLNTTVVTEKEVSVANIANFNQLPQQQQVDLQSKTPLQKAALSAIRQRLNLLPPSPAMTGIYTMVDNTRGVWKAPANISINSAVSPAANITQEQQEDMNVCTNGKSINAIRAFIGEGTLVWGARTLDGNGLDWRNVSVRRTMIMLEQSIKLAARAYVFAPNNAATWSSIKAMIQQFLISIWQSGGLIGAKPEDAFSILIGLGETMTAQDILDGNMRMTILVALSRPAEFIEITFQQQMQSS